MAKQSAPALVVAEIPMAGDPVALAKSAPPPAIASFRATGDPVALADTVRLPSVAALADATPPDLFSINREFNWHKPHGQWMNQMLKDIDAARKAGDTETYKTLTRRYAEWADRYLRRDTPRSGGQGGL